MPATIMMEYCVECGEMAEFIYDGEQWMCTNCGCYNSQGGFSDTDPIGGDDGLDET